MPRPCGGRSDAEHPDVRPLVLERRIVVRRRPVPSSSSVRLPTIAPVVDGDQDPVVRSRALADVGDPRRGTCASILRLDELAVRLGGDRAGLVVLGLGRASRISIVTDRALPVAAAMVNVVDHARLALARCAR